MVDILFPQKGWNTNYPRNNQPDGTSPDLLNVVPYDRDQRNRGAVRAGVSKFAPTQLGGSGGSPVLLLDQVTAALDPSTVIPVNLLVSEPFTYANNTTVGSIGAPDWRVSYGGATVIPLATVNPAALTVQNNTVVNDGSLSGTGSAAAAIYQPTVSLGPAYILEADIYVDHASSSGIASYGCALMARVNKTTYATTDGLCYYVMNDVAVIRNSNGSVSATFTFGTPLATGFHHIELHVNGNTFTGWVDGVPYVSVSATLSSTQVGFGFWVGGLRANAPDLGLKNFQLFTANSLSSFRQTTVVAVSGGTIYTGDATGFTAAGGGTGVLSATVKPQAADRVGYVYFVDGLHDLQVLNTITKTVSTPLFTANTTETATTLGACTLACVWRDRLVLAAPATNAQNFFMSRSGTVPNNNGTITLDFEYAQTDPAAAVAGNLARAGAIGEPINCLMPWTDDVLVIGGDHNIYKIEGDIAAGGQILIVSDEVGTLGADCWTLDPNGTLYFVGTNGLYSMGANGPPQNLSNDAVREFFVNIDRTLNYVVLVWDRDRNGLWIHVTPVNTGSATHLFYDAATGGFFPIKYPNVQGPLSGIVFDGDATLDRQLLLGGRDGYVRTIDPSMLTDDGTSISSYVQIGPYRPAGDAALSVLEALEVVLGDAPTGFTQNDFGLALTVQTGADAYHALLFPERTLTIAMDRHVGRRKRLLQRLSGGSWFFKISGVANRLWSLEKLVALFTEGGLQRRVLTNQD